MMPKGHFVEVFVDTPLEVCEERDVKGIYAQARAGKSKASQELMIPYEPPENPELALNTTNHSGEDNARLILKCLCERGLFAQMNRSNASRRLLRKLHFACN